MISIPMDPVYVGLMVFVRVGFILTFFPLFGEDFVPLRIRIVLSVLIAFVLTPVVPVRADQFPSTAGALILMIGSEALLGFSFGLVGRALFAVIQFAGQIAGEQMGFGVVNAIDPTGSHQVSVVAEMQYLLSILVFMSADLHHVMLNAMAASFEILEPGQAAMSAGVGEFFVRIGSSVFELSVRFAMPVIIVVFTINVAMATIGRAVPEINVFLESFPLRIIGGLSITLLSLGLLVRLWIGLFQSAEPALQELLFLLRG